MILISTLISIASCSNQAEENMINNNTNNIEQEQLSMGYQPLTIRNGERPATTDVIPHHQLDLGLIPDVHEEMIRRIYEIPGIEDQPSVIMSWQGLSLESNIDIINPQALIGARELGHVHDDGSLHIFLDPIRATQAIESGWAIEHPFYVDGRDGWEGFVMLYTPQTIEELNVIFQLIVDAFNYVSGQNIEATDFY